MKTQVEVYFKSYQDGVNEKGKKWQMLQVADEQFNNFNLFGEKAEQYKDKQTGNKLKVEIEILPRFNYETKKFENVIRLV